MPACRHAKSVDEGIKFGEKYNSLGISDKGTERINEILARYRPWIEKYRGGNSALSCASGINHESRGDPLATSDEKIGESGLMSVTTGLSRKYDIDPFDPEANIYAGNRLKNERVQRILDDERWSWLKHASPFDFTKILWKLPGSLGFGGWKQLMGRIFPEPPTNEDILCEPFDHVARWIRLNRNRVPKIGRMSPGLVACRVVRCSGTMFLDKHDALMHADEVAVIPRPDHLPHFNERKYERVWKTKEGKRRHRKFPEYLREPDPMNVNAGGISDALDTGHHDPTI